jgi:hypothetical protein
MMPFDHPEPIGPRPLCSCSTPDLVAELSPDTEAVRVVPSATLGPLAALYVAHCRRCAGVFLGEYRVATKGRER